MTEQDTTVASSKYVPTIGLEIHAELKTASKMFCACKNDPDEETPNKNVCAVCMGHPGTLPSINKQAVLHVIRVGTAVGGTIADFTEWDRKNYFYPDIPKAYQISQYAFPLIKGGSLTVDGADDATHTVELTRIHLEEDTAKSSHDKGDYSLVDFNRSSVPLMELVTEPVIHDAKTASNFARELQLLLRTLGAGDANMEKGEMRVEANISVAKNSHDPKNPALFGTKVEVKNLNSFKSVERAIEYEVKRHIDIIERAAKGEVDASGQPLRIIQETRGFDENTGKTFSQRVKEDSNDYRYFPDPDLPKLFVSEVPEFAPDAVRASLPELPWQKRGRFVKDWGMKAEDAEVFVSELSYAQFIESAIATIEANGAIANKAENKLRAVNYFTSDLIGLMKNDKENAAGAIPAHIKPEAFAEIIAMLAEKKISSRGAKDILIELYKNGASDAYKGDPKAIAEAKQLYVVVDVAALTATVHEIVTQNAKAVEEYKAGKASSLQFLIGQAMKATKGAGDPETLREMFLKELV